MDTDDLLPNDGTYFMPREPVDQVIARKKERSKTLEDLKIITSIVDHFEKRIEALGSVDAMPDEAKLDPQKFLIIHNANEIARKHLISEKEWVESLVDIAGQTDT